MQLSVSPPLEDTEKEWVSYIERLRHSTDNTMRKFDSHRLHQHYKGKYREELLAKLRARVGSEVKIKDLQVWQNNLFRWAINTLTITYDGLVTRAAEGDQEQLDEAWKYANLSFSSADAWLRFDRMLLMQPKLVGEKTKYAVYGQYQFDVIWDEERTELTAVILSDYATSSDKTHYWVYTAERIYHFKGSKAVTVTNNILGVIPFVVILADDLGFEDYLDPMIELAEQQLELDIMTCNVLYTHRLQSFALPVLTLTPDSALGDTANDADQPSTNIDAPGKSLGVNSPGKALVLYKDELGRAETFQFVSPNVNFADLLTPIKDFAISYLRNCGVPDGVASIDVSSATVKPATTRFIADQKIKDLNNKYEWAFKEAEQKLFNLVSLMNGWNQADTFTVGYSPKPRTLEYMEPDEFKLLKDMGVIDEADVRATISGITRQQAIEILAENKKQGIQGDDLNGRTSETEPGIEPGKPGTTDDTGDSTESGGERA